MSGLTQVPAQYMSGLPQVPAQYVRATTGTGTIYVRATTGTGTILQYTHLALCFMICFLGKLAKLHGSSFLYINYQLDAPIIIYS